MSQGWIFDLPALTKANHFTLDLDVLAPGGTPIGVLSMGRGRNYEQEGSPELMSTVAITVNGRLVLELAAPGVSGKTGGSDTQNVASRGKSYEKITTEGWRVRATVNDLAAKEHPKLGDGTEAQDPVFEALSMDVEVVGDAATPYLGLTADNVTASRAALENLRGADLQLIDHGVIIRHITPGGPADKAGLREGDIILAINGGKIDEQNPLSLPLSRLHAGDKVVMDVLRDTKSLKLDVILGTRP